MMATLERKPEPLPLPGRPCAPRWLTPHLPIGWTVRADRKFFYVVEGQRLRAMFDLFAERNHTIAGIRHAITLAAEAGEPPPEALADEEQRMRLGSAIILTIHGMPSNIVVAALNDVISTTLANIPGDFPRKMGVMQMFVKQLMFQFSRQAGVEFEEINLNLPPRPSQTKH
jgi:hypothetical protein